MLHIPFFSAEQICKANVPLKTVYNLVLEGFRLHGLGLYENPPKQGIHTRHGAFLNAMPTYLPSLDIAGTKLVSVYPDNPSRGMNALMGIIVLIDPNTGESRAILDAHWITNARTAMVSMLTSKFLSAKDSPVFGIVGATGASGRAHIDAIACIYPDSKIIVNNRYIDRCSALCSEYSEKNIDLHIEMNQKSVVRDSDVIIVCTSHLDSPIFKCDWTRKGQCVLNVHEFGWPADITEYVDVITCDDRIQLLDPINGLATRYPKLNPDFELGEVICGKHPGRENENDIIFSFNYGLGLFDIILADYILKQISLE